MEMQVFENELSQRLRSLAEQAIPDEREAADPIDPWPIGRDPRFGRVVLAIAATVALIVVGLVAITTSNRGGTAVSNAGTDATVSVASSPPATLSPATGPVVSTSPAEPVASTSPAAQQPATTADLPDEAGSAMIDVATAQRRLAGLGFVTGPDDGILGSYTRQAIWAFEKLVLGRPYQDGLSGQIDAEVAAALESPVTIEPRRAEIGRHIEVYLPEQVLVLFDAEGQPELISHISTGTLDESGNPAEFAEESTAGTISGFAVTPPGIFEVQRIERGKFVKLLGGMVNPIFFDGNLAIHGAYEVPDRPASHGTISVNILVAAQLVDLVEPGDPIYVWDGQQEPEDVAAD